MAPNVTRLSLGSGQRAWPKPLSLAQPVLNAKLGEGFEIAVGGEKCRVHRAGQRDLHHVDLRQDPAPGPQIMVDLGIERSDR